MHTCRYIKHVQWQGVFDIGYGVVLDSGTTYTHLPREAYQAFVEALLQHTSAAGLSRVDGPDPTVRVGVVLQWISYAQRSLARQTCAGKGRRLSRSWIDCLGSFQPCRSTCQVRLHMNTYLLSVMHPFLCPKG